MTPLLSPKKRHKTAVNRVRVSKTQLAPSREGFQPIWSVIRQLVIIQSGSNKARLKDDWRSRLRGWEAKKVDQIPNLVMDFNDGHRWIDEIW